MRFADLLKQKSITQTTLARQIGFSQSLISLWIRGDCQPQIEVLPKLAEALGVSVEEIVNCFK